MTARIAVAVAPARRTAASARPRRSPRRARSRRRRRRTSCSGRPAPACAPSSSAIVISGRADQVDAAGQRQRRTRRPQALARQVDRHQRRRARRVDGQARALQARARTTAGRRRCCARCPCQCRRRSPRATAFAHAAAGSRRVEMPTKTPVAVPASRSGAMPGVLQRLPRHLEQQPLLRVHARRLARRDAEEARLEPVDASRKPPHARRRSCRARRVGVVVGVDVPAVGRAPRVIASTPLAQQLPERLGSVGAAREPAADADDRDRLACDRSGGLQAGRSSSSRQQQREPLERDRC